MAKCDFLVLGHTHVPFVRSLDKGTILNPGSIGQPRDGDPRASLTIYDHRLRRFEVIRLAYDIDAVAEAIKSSGLPSFLSMRLLQRHLKLRPNPFPMAALAIGDVMSSSLPGGRPSSMRILDGGSILCAATSIGLEDEMQSRASSS
jgi:hypothetical protein